MCGRFACRLSKNRLRRSCSYKPSGSYGESVLPAWVDLSSCGSYVPSYNIGPSIHTPVLVGNSHWKSEACGQGERLLVPMSWGLIPSWHKGDPKDFGAKTINCRIEGVLEKPTYKAPLTKGQRCVVLAEGFYEWKTEREGKQPFYVYFPQPKGVDMTTRSWEQVAEDDENWIGPRLLTMAGLFETILLNGEKFLSYTVITRSASPSLSWLHSRMPAVLDGEEMVQKWLDTKTVSFQEALNLLDNPVNLEWHPVSSTVGNVHNNSVECVTPVKTESKKTKTITDWFKPKQAVKGQDPSPAKKFKSET